MRAFTCGHCGQLVFFENSLCLRCSTELGFVPSRLEVVALTEERAAGLRRCGNAVLAGCNWMLEADEPGPLCRSCRLTRTRPSDHDAEGLAAFVKAEGAKRRLLFGLLELGLPVEAGGLRFDLLSSRSAPVTTGHADGLITIEAVTCLAGCDRAPMFQIQSNEGLEYHENMSVDKTMELVAALKQADKGVK